MSSHSTAREAETPAAALASFVAETTHPDVPVEARDTAIRAITDTVGVTLAGLSHESAHVAGGVTGFDTSGFPRARSSGGSRAELALLYGTAAHALDYDDLSWAMDGHPSVILLPPLLALAGAEDDAGTPEDAGTLDDAETLEDAGTLDDAETPDDADTPDVDTVAGADVVTAYAVGFEVACAVAEPVSPEHYEAGWHATSTFGAFGAAAAAASLLDLDVETTETALNIAASTASGVKENFGSMTKPLHAGLAARSGVTAALLARDGFTAGEHAVDGKHGFWSLYGAGAGEDAALDAEPTSDGWTLVDRGIHVKKYPACYFTHSAIAAARSLAVEHDIDASDVQSVAVSAAGGAGDALAYADPSTSLESKFSMEHAVAVALTADRVSLEWFEPDAVDDPRVAALRDRVDFSVDDSLPYDSHAATVRIETADGAYETTQEHPPWTHAHPPSRDALRGKFLEAATRTVTADAAETTFDRLQALDDNDLETVLEAVRA